MSAGVDAIVMLENLSRSYPALWKMVTGLCYVIGFIFALRGVYYLKNYGELRTMTAAQTNLKIPAMLFIVASIFMYIPTGYKVASMTVLGYDSPMAYSNATSSINPMALHAVTGLISFIGLLSFVRGWMILVKHTEQPGGQATVGKAITHIIGGLMAMNVLGVADIIWNTFGFKFGT